MVFPMINEGFSYEVAVSVTDGDQFIASLLVRELELMDVDTYFYARQPEAAWGENLNNFLSELYGNRARIVVVFYSNKYPDSDFAGIELNAALGTATPKVLPIYVGDDLPEGPLKEIGAIKWEDSYAFPRKLAESIFRKIHQEPSWCDITTARLVGRFKRSRKIWAAFGLFWGSIYIKEGLTDESVASIILGVMVVFWYPADLTYRAIFNENDDEDIFRHVGTALFILFIYLVAAGYDR